MGGTTQTSSSTTTPLSPQVQPTVDKLLGGIQKSFDAGPQSFGQSLYVPSGAVTNWGETLLSNAAANPAYDAAWKSGLNYNNNLVGQGGLTPGMQGNIGTTNDVTAGYGQMAQNGGLTAGQQGNINTVNNVGQGYAGLAGAYDQNAPGYDTLRTTALNDAVQGVTSPFLTSGMFGSKAYINDATKAAVNAIAPLDYQNYQNSVNNQYRSLDSQQGAATNAFGMGQTGVGNQFNALAGQLSGANQAYGMSQGGINNAFAANAQLPGLYSASTLPGQTAMQVGAAQDANQNAIRQGEYDQWARQYNAPTDLYAKLSSILAGNAAAGGTSTTSTQPGTPWWQTAAGLGLGALALA